MPGIRLLRTLLLCWPTAHGFLFWPMPDTFLMPPTGGSAKQARDRRFQAVLPLRGKILNVERNTDAAMYKNEEIAALIVALGLGLKGDAVPALRYGKVWDDSQHAQVPLRVYHFSGAHMREPSMSFAPLILRRAQVILLTDADVDGAHIRTLLLTFLFRYARALFEAGHVYVGVPPLYRLEAGRSSQYLYSDAELRAALGGRDPSTVGIQRFKVCLCARGPGLHPHVITDVV